MGTVSDRAAPANGRLRRIRDRHFDCYLDLAQAANESAGSDVWLGAAGSDEWLGAFDAELANIRAALEWGLATSRRETPMFAASLLWYWQKRRLYNEGRQILDRVLRDPDLLPLERTDPLLAAGSLAAIQGDPTVARDHLEAAHRLAVSAGDPARQARAAHGLGWCLFKLSRIADAVAAFVEARELSASLSVAEHADVLRGLGWARAYHEGPEISLELHREARALLEAAQDPALLLHYLNETTLLVGCGRVEEALALAETSVEVARATGRFMSLALAAKSNAALASGDRGLLHQVIEEAIPVARSERQVIIEARLHQRLAADAITAGEMERARVALDSGLRVLDASLDALDFNGVAFRAELLLLRADLAEDEGDIDVARELYRQAIGVYARSSVRSHANALVGLARLYVEHGDEGAREALENRALELLGRIDDEIGALVRVDLAVLGDEVEEALRLTTKGLAVAPTLMPRDIPGLLCRKAAALAELARLDEAAATADELVGTGRGGTNALLERARIHIGAGNREAARSDLGQVASVVSLGWASHQLQLATTLARLALLDGRDDGAVELWSAVVAYRTANRRLAPRLSRRFEEPLRELNVGTTSPELDSRAALDALRALVSDGFAALDGD